MRHVDRLWRLSEHLQVAVETAHIPRAAHILHHGPPGYGCSLGRRIDLVRSHRVKRLPRGIVTGPTYCGSAKWRGARLPGRGEQLAEARWEMEELNAAVALLQEW